MNQTEAIAAFLAWHEEAVRAAPDYWLDGYKEAVDGLRSAVDQPPPQPASDAEIEAWGTRAFRDGIYANKDLPAADQFCLTRDCLDAGIALMRRAAPPSIDKLRRLREQITTIVNAEPPLTKNSPADCWYRWFLCTQWQGELGHDHAEMVLRRGIGDALRGYDERIDSLAAEPPQPDDGSKLAALSRQMRLNPNLTDMVFAVRDTVDELVQRELAPPVLPPPDAELESLLVRMRANPYDSHDWGYAVEQIIEVLAKRAGAK
jgi:hypothetical protein